MISKKKILIIIPSRLKSTRLKTKALRMILKKQMIIRVVEQTMKFKVGRVIVAAGDKKIQKLLIRNSFESYLSVNSHNSGTDRIQEIYKNFFNGYDYILNLQGDMPYFKKELLTDTLSLLEDDQADIGTAACILDPADYQNQNVVKVQVSFKNKQGFAQDFIRNVKSVNQCYHHIGIYAFRPKSLENFVMLKQSKNEKNRGLEQMRALDNGMKIKVALINSKPFSVDTKEDLIKIRNFLKHKHNEIRF